MRTQTRVCEVIRAACVLDVVALKPGNVHIYASGHGMVPSDFLRSAAVAAPALSDVNCGTGERIFRAIEATNTEVGCNTNLGIVLLAAPLACALDIEGKHSLRARLKTVLECLTVEDAQWAYAAIRLATPAGLGTTSEQDVASTPTGNLKEVMALASVRDRIAFQYANDFVDVFETGVPTLKNYLRRWRSMPWAVVGVYLAFLAHTPDSHIARKFGVEHARHVCRSARALESAFKACENPAPLVMELMKLDHELKQAGVNPGTSADLTVASVIALLLDA